MNSSLNLSPSPWWLYHRRKQEKSELKPRPEAPSRKKKPAQPADAPEANQPRSRFMGTAELPDALRKVLDDNFRDSWPPDDAVIDNMTQEDQVVFAVESEPVGNYDQIRQELISAKVLSVENTYVRTRVLAPVAYAEHHGAHAGHGSRVGDLVEVPRSKVLLAVRSTAPREPDTTARARPSRNSSRATSRIRLTACVHRRPTIWSCRTARTSSNGRSSASTSR